MLRRQCGRPIVREARVVLAAKVIVRLQEAKRFRAGLVAIRLKVARLFANYCSLAVAVFAR